MGTDASIIGLLAPDVNPILNNKNPFAGKAKYSIILHTVEDDIEITRIDGVEKIKDYSNNITDFIVLNFKVYGSMFTKKIYPNRDNLEVTLTLSGDNGYEVSNRYKFVIMNFPEGIDNDPLVKDGTTIDTNTVFNIEGQCLIREVEGLRALYTDGIFTSTDLYSMIHNEMVRSFDFVKVDGQSNTDIVLDMDEFDNNMIYGHIIVKTGTPLLDLPSIFQNNNYGIYNGNIGTYISITDKKTTVYVYPLYDFTQYDKKTKKLMIFALNNKKLDHVENTFILKDDVVKILCKSNITSKDSGDNELIDGGSSIISSNPYLITNRNVNVTEKNVIYDKNSQISGVNIKDKRDGVNKATYVGNESNMYKVRSDYNKAMCAIYTVQWSFSNSEYIYPGMPCCFFYDDSSRGLMELKGTVIHVYESYTVKTNTINTLITIAVEKPMNIS